MKEYLEGIVEAANSLAGAATKEVIEEIKEILSDEKFLLQKGLRSLVDQDARVGYKSKTDSFFGYKTEFSMITDERIITAVGVHSGEYVGGTEYLNLLEKTEEAGVNVETVTADKAYFRKDILDELAQRTIERVIPVSASAYKIDESLYSYNKGSDEWFCRTGNRTVKKETLTKNNRKGKRMVNEKVHATLLALVGGYVLYLAYQLYGKFRSGTKEMPDAVFILAIAGFAAAGIAVLVFAWKTYRKAQKKAAEETEEKQGPPAEHEGNELDAGPEP